jgi:hypothetical protein
MVPFCLMDALNREVLAAVREQDLEEVSACYRS